MLVAWLRLIVRLVHLLTTLRLAWVTYKVLTPATTTVTSMERYLFVRRGLLGTTRDIQLWLACLLVWTCGERRLASIHLLHAQFQGLCWCWKSAFRWVSHTLESEGYERMLGHDLVIVKNCVLTRDIQGFEEGGHQLSYKHIRSVVSRGCSIVSRWWFVVRPTTSCPRSLVFGVWTDRTGRRVSVGLHCLLEGPHFLNLDKLTAPLLINGISLVPFYPKIFRQAPLCLFQIFKLFL